MAEVQEPTPAAQEPSMEEILASIRKIISDDAPAAEGAAAPAEASQDVIELTQMVQDDGSVVDAKPAPPIEEKPMPPEPTPPPVVATPAPAPAPAPAKPEKPAGEGLVSEPAVSTAATALSALASTVEIERLASAPAITSTPIGNGARTLEDMALELMRPLLKQWLDQNLPATVDRLVQKEIERISRKAQD